MRKHINIQFFSAVIQSLLWFHIILSHMTGASAWLSQVGWGKAMRHAVWVSAQLNGCGGSATNLCAFLGSFHQTTLKGRFHYPDNCLETVCLLKIHFTFLSNHLRILNLPKRHCQTKNDILKSIKTKSLCGLYFSIAFLIYWLVWHYLSDSDYLTNHFYETKNNCSNITWF